MRSSAAKRAATSRRSAASSASARSRSRGELRRKEILDAALACFLEKGLDLATMADIRARSGASTGSIYHLFDSKEAIAGALFVDSQRVLHQRVLAAMQRARGAEAVLAAVIRVYVAWVVAEPERARFVLDAPSSRAAARVHAELAEESRAFVAAVSVQIDHLVREGSIRALPMDLFVAVVLGPMRHWARQHLDGVAGTTPRVAARELANAAWRAVRNGAA